MQKLLRNRKTGASFPYSEKLAKNPDMELVGANFEEHIVDTTIQKPPAVALDTPDPEPQATSTDSIVLSRASKQEMIDYAKANYGVDLDPSETNAVMREQLKTLIEEE